MRTKRIKLGLGVLSLPNHHPVQVADRVVLLDHLTRGQVILGAGPGQEEPPKDVSRSGSFTGYSTASLLSLAATNPVKRLQEKSGGFGTWLNLQGDWANTEVTLRNYELIAASVAPVPQRFDPGARTRLPGLHHQLAARRRHHEGGPVHRQGALRQAARRAAVMAGARYPPRRLVIRMAMRSNDVRFGP